MRIHRHGGLLTKKQNDELVESSKTEFWKNKIFSKLSVDKNNGLRKMHSPCNAKVTQTFLNNKKQTTVVATVKDEFKKQKLG